MADGHISGALRRLRGLLGAECAGGPTDGELLRRYVVASDEAAFEALLRRHGPMVLGVCRRLLTGAQEVDDAFQATFLILVRKAHSIGDGERVANWLYGVAYRVAVRARAQAARRRARQRVLTDVAGNEAPVEAVRAEICAVLDEEVSRLPARYREAVVCCYLEGRTQEEAAHLLGWPKGTVATRLNRARELLRTRLTRRGFLLAGGTLAGLLSQGAAEAAVPAPLLTATLGTAGKAVAGAAVPPGAAALDDGVLRGLVLGRLKAVAAAALTLAVVTGGGVLTLGPGESVPEPSSAAHVCGARGVPSPSWLEVPAEPVEPRTKTIHVLVIFVDGRTLLNGKGNGSVWCCEQPHSAAEGAARGQPGRMIAVALSTDGQSAASIIHDRTLTTLPRSTGSRGFSLKLSGAHALPIGLALSPEGGNPAAAPGCGAGVWSAVWTGSAQPFFSSLTRRPLPLPVPAAS